MKRLLSKLRETKLSFKIIAITLLCLVIPFTGVSVFSYEMLEERIIERSLSEADYGFKQMTYFLSSSLSDIAYSASLISSSSYVQDFLEGEFRPDAQSLYHFKEILAHIEQVGSSSILVSSCSVYCTNTTLPEGWSTLFHISRLENSFLEKCDFENSEAGWFFGENTVLTGMRNFTKTFYEEGELIYICPIFSSGGDYLGFLKLGVDRKRLFDSAVKGSVNQSLAVAVEENILYHPDNTPAEVLSALRYDSPTDTIFIDGRHAVMKRNLSDLNMTACMFSDISANSEELQALRIVMLLAALILMLITGILLTVIISLLMRRIKRVTKRMGKIAVGDFTPLENMGPMDEAGKITAAFNSMAVNISNLQREIRETEQVRKETELAMLRAQINPHFVYNVLEIFKTRLEGANQSEIAESMVVLGRMLRYSTNWEKESRLSDEISHLNYYIKLQNVLLPGRINCYIDCASDIRAASVPKMILQPIVENCIVHGLREDTPLNIMIRAEKASEKLIITVFDDGLGIEASQVTHLNEELRSPTPTATGKGDKVRISNIGLSNISERIRMNGDEDCGVTVRSEKGLFTEVTLRMNYTVNEKKENF